MELSRARRHIEKVFQNEFIESEFLTFSSNFFNLPSDIDQNQVRISDSYADKIYSAKLLFKYTDIDNKVIHVLVVHLKKDTSLDRGRVMQRNFISDYLRSQNGHAAVVSFSSSDSDDWRFSLIEIQYELHGLKVNINESPAKRWSFLVGKNEHSHTAKSQLIEFLTNDKGPPSLSSLKQAFDIEKVSEEFYEKYKDLFLKLKESLDENIENDLIIRKDFESKNISSADFAKKTLGQIVFIYFLQKKGWFGVSIGKDWGTGRKDFLRYLFNSKESGENFFDIYLEPLFYESIAREREGQVDPRINCRIPFLNGGLIEPMHGYAWDKTNIQINDEIFTNSVKTVEGDIGNGILDVFDRYNFTVNESEPLEKEVAVDPEMLGKVFERLLPVKNRDSQGAFYTPRDVVHYICKRSLIDHIYTQSEKLIPYDDIQSFINQSSFRAKNFDEPDSQNSRAVQPPESIISNAAKIDKLLADIKICDPSVGSGAFPLGILNEIVSARAILLINLDVNFSNYELKLHAISNSIYGVDIDPAAVEIAKLRLWLSLIVDEIEPIPLPNLDHKIMQGNSLVSQFNGVSLFDEGFLDSLDAWKTELKEIQQEIDDLSKDYISQYEKISKDKLLNIQELIKSKKRRINFLQKKIQPDQTTSNLFEVNDIHQEAQKKSKDIQNKISQYVTINNHIEKKKLQQQIDNLKWDLIETTLKINDDEEKLNEISFLKNKNIKPFFIWPLEFGEIFRNEGGFDLIIGNPPYVEARNKEKFPEQLKEDCQSAVKKRWGEGINTLITKGSDLMIYFFELSLYLLSDRGINAFITQNSWLSTEYGKKFHNFLLKQNLSIEVEDSNKRHFSYGDGPQVNTVISFIQKNIHASENYVKFSKDKESTIYEFDDSALSYKWSILFQPNDILKIVSKIHSLGSREGYSIGQGLNDPFSKFISEDEIAEFNIDRNSCTPIFTKDDGSPFVVKQTKRFIIDDSFLDKSLEMKNEVESKIVTISPRRAQSKPKLILPRGIGSFFCAINFSGGYSSSFVEIYADSEKVIENLWLFLNSSLGFLLRELSGRFNLGGGMLKAEAADLKLFPLLFDFKKNDEIKNLIEQSFSRSSSTDIEELMNHDVQKKIDNLVFNFLNISSQESALIIEHFKKLVEIRSKKSKT